MLTPAAMIAARPLVPASERGRPRRHLRESTDLLDAIATDHKRLKINSMMLTTLFLLFMVWALAYGVFAGSATSELIGNSYVDRDIFGWEIPTTAMNSIEPGIIMIATPLLAWGLAFLARRGRFPHSVYQMVIGALLSCAAVVLLGWLVTAIPAGVWGSRHRFTGRGASLIVF